MITVGSVYRHPSGNVSHYTESLDNCLKNFDAKNMLVVGGDINVDLLKSDKPMTQN